MIQLPDNTAASSLVPDMTALLDVIFILLVFMMLTANVAPQLLEIDLPEAVAGSDMVQPEAITLGISEQAEYSIDQQRFSSGLDFYAALEQVLQSYFQQHGSRPQVIVAADKNSELQPFVELAGFLSEKNIAVVEVQVSGDN